jgi:hypothetical protein
LALALSVSPLSFSRSTVMLGPAFSSPPPRENWNQSPVIPHADGDGHQHDQHRQQTSHLMPLRGGPANRPLVEDGRPDAPPHDIGQQEHSNAAGSLTADVGSC